MLAVVLAWAGDPWNEKPSAEWNQKEVKKVLLDSPWVRKVSYGGRPAFGIGTMESSVNRAGLNQNQAENEAVLAQGSRSASRPAVTEGRPEESPGGKNPRSPSSTAPRGELIIRWFSARTIGEGLIRNWELQLEDLHKSEEEGQQPADPRRRGLEQNIQTMKARLARPRTFYEVVVSPIYLSETNQLGLDAKSYLEPRKSREKVHPAHIEFQGPSVVFYFPREVEGRPVIGPEEKKIRFETRIRDRKLRTDFDLRKMTRDGKPDL